MKYLQIVLLGLVLGLTELVAAQNYTVEFASGKTEHDVKILQKKPGKIEKTYSSISLVNSLGKQKAFGAAGIKSISQDDTVVLEYNAQLKGLVAPQDKAELLKALPDDSKKAVSNPGTAKKPAVPAKKSTSNSKESVEEVPDPNDPYAKLSDMSIPYMQRRMLAAEIESKTGVLPWVELGSEEYVKRLDEQKELVKSYQSTFPALKCYETRYFLFASDAPPAVYKEIISVLDNMYSLLCVNFGIPKVDIEPEVKPESTNSTTDSTADSKTDLTADSATDSTVNPATRSTSVKKTARPANAKKEWKNIWQAKCIVVVFMNNADFNRFEQLNFGAAPPEHVLGLCHQRTDGRVVISCKADKNKFDFYGTLVHETTHGFTFMHKAAMPLPNWLNEGISDWCAGVIVKGGTNVVNKQRAAVAVMRQKGSLEGIFFRDRIDAWQYGAASLMVDLLLKTNAKNFIHLINDIKEGKDPQQALQKNYNVNFETFARALGQTCGCRNLRP